MNEALAKRTAPGSRESSQLVDRWFPALWVILYLLLPVSGWASEMFDSWFDQQRDLEALRSLIANGHADAIASNGIGPAYIGLAALVHDVLRLSPEDSLVAVTRASYVLSVALGLILVRVLVARWASTRRWSRSCRSSRFSRSSSPPGPGTGRTSHGVTSLRRSSPWRCTPRGSRADGRRSPQLPRRGLCSRCSRRRGASSSWRSLSPGESPRSLSGRFDCRRWLSGFVGWWSARAPSSRRPRSCISRPGSVISSSCTAASSTRSRDLCRVRRSRTHRR